ncbi:hypothetical protein DX914_01615 [Lysobacter silvisoli]|uniref:Uncharacterized protein n=1 Tax=Lysobacter silvisoli TaxID=2293254 RepID=A0A371K1T5_9GAMM|nr:hypothetical protein DX914_01615 [Lysobacter silvisoli]
MVFAGLAAVSGGAAALDSQGAVRAANRWNALRTGDDIQFDHRASRVLIADLDRDGVDEVVYLLTATCVQANFDCENEVVVMTPLRKGDPRIRISSLDHPETLAKWRQVEQAGYADDASLQVPGEVRALAIVDGRIRVEFDATLKSPTCKRSDRGAAEPCPEPGRYRWTLAWQPGELTRARETR